MYYGLNEAPTCQSQFSTDRVPNWLVALMMYPHPCASYVPCTFLGSLNLLNLHLMTGRVELFFLLVWSSSLSLTIASRVLPITAIVSSDLVLKFACQVKAVVATAVFHLSSLPYSQVAGENKQVHFRGSVTNWLTKRDEWGGSKCFVILLMNAGIVYCSHREKQL